MDQIRVMIVDDEILAIEDIVDLINWEEIDFKIVATVRNGRQALDKFDTVHPDVIISDIRMPVMDGLEMSQAILSINRNVKILLLTGYEEFEYAKKAIKLGVFDYILKNEITKNVLYSKVMELKDEIKKEKYEAQLILRNLLKDLINGQSIETDRIPQILTLPQNRALLFIMFELDLSFLSAISDFNEDRSDAVLETKQFTKYVSELPEDFSIYELVHVEKHRIILLLNQNRNMSEYETRRSVCSFVRLIQQSFKINEGKTLSAFVHLRKIKMNTYHDIYEQYKLLSKYKVFFGREQFYDAINVKIDVCRDEIETDEKKLTQYVGEFDSENTALYVNQLFNEAVANGYNLEGLVSVVKELLHVLQAFKRILYRTNTELNNPQTLFEETMWYKLDDIKQWFVNQFINVIAGLQNTSKQRYSSDVLRALEYIHKFYFKEDLTIGEVSEKIGLSVTHLSAKLKKETGLTFLEYLTNYRIEKAKKLLGSDNCKIYEISNRIGYKTSQYFSKVFYKATGKTPVDYRKEFFNL